MKKEARGVLAVMALSAVVTGCGRKGFGAGCEQAEELTSPWPELGLPIDAKETRVCSSSASELKLRSYSWASKADAQEAIAAALASSGFEQDKCMDLACYYAKDGYRISVQPMDFRLPNKKALQTVVLRYQKDLAQRSSQAARGDESADPPSPTAKATATGARVAMPTADTTDGPLGIKECDSYLETMKACGEDAKTIALSRKGFQINLEQGKSRDSVAKSCAAIAKVYTCRKR
jgi:hypothetical protein